MSDENDRFNSDGPTTDSPENGLVLHIRHADGRWEEFRTDLPAIRIGRADSNDLVIADMQVSRHHAVLLNRPTGLEIVSMGGRNGIVVDGRRLDRANLNGTREFVLGSTTLEVLAEDTTTVADLEEQERNALLELESLELEEALSPPHVDPPVARSPEVARPVVRPEAAEPVPPTLADEERAWSADASGDDDDEDDVDEWPVYSLRQRILSEKNPDTPHGEQVWEVIRYRDDILYGSTQLRTKEKLRSEDGRRPLIRISRDGAFEVAIDPELEIATDPAAEKFVPVTQQAPSGWRRWFQVDGDPILLRRNGIRYLARQRYSDPLYLEPIKTRIDPLSIRLAGVSTWIHIMLVTIVSIVTPSISGVSARMQSADLERFVEIAMKDLTPTPLPKVVEAPKPAAVEKKQPAVKKKKKTKVAKRSKRRRSGKSTKSRPTKRAKGQVADLSRVGALGKLGGMGLFSKKATNSKKLAAAVSNLDAVRSHGGVQTYRVSGSIKALPGKEVRLARISGVKTTGGSPKGDGFGVASVGKKRGHKVKGVVVNVEPPPLSISVKGGLTRAEIAKVVQENVSAIRYCYEKSLLDDPSLAGKIVLNWTIALTGRVSEGGIRNSSVRNPGVHRCLLKEVRSWKFPKPRDGGLVLVSYPFVFNNASF